MSTPTRIQRSRAKGWRMPADTVAVSRPSRWGNPFQIVRVDCDGGLGVCWGVSAPRVDRRTCLGTLARAHEVAVELFDLHISPMGSYEYDPDDLERLRKDLRGKNLACWCPPEVACHVDVLLRLANA